MRLIIIIWPLQILRFCSTSEHGIFPAVFRGCKNWFSQNSNGIKNEGNFTSPNYPSEYPPNTECVYTFVARPSFRVQLIFEDFVLDNSIPKCEHYVDLYAEVKGHFDFPNEKLSNRFCGSISPGSRVSLYNVIVLVFKAKGKKGARGFSGKFEFFDEEKYGMVHKGNCDRTLHGRNLRHGSIFSPTYPGKYPTNLVCKYKLIGEQGHRIQLYFKDFDLYFGGPHCPFDALTVFDGDSDQAPIIQKLCGLHQTLEIFSRSNKIYLEFRSTDPPYAEHRGFELIYTFSDAFVNIEKMLGNDPHAEHIRGSECDVRIKSGGETEHSVRSPGYPDPYPTNAECTVILDGMRGRQKLENAAVKFLSFRVNSVQHEDQKMYCSEANVSLYHSTTDLKDAKSEAAPDLKFCSPENEPQLFLPYESSGSRMILIFRSNDSTGPGFEAKIKFKTNFGITGTKVATKSGQLCHFEFTRQEESRDKNTFNSPRFPDDYFASTTCIYDIKAEKNQRILIEFEQFDLHEPASEADAGGDRVEMYNAYKENGSFVLYGNFSSIWTNSVPGPAISQSNWVRVIFHSDAQGTKTGFKAFYKFLPLRNPSIACKPPGMPENPVCVELISGETHGVLSSPNYGEKYPIGLDRLWEIRVPPKFRVLLEPIDLKIEGQMSVDGKFSQCQQAVIRVFDDADLTGKEFCGDVIKNPGVRQFVSTNNILYLSFVTSPYQVMGLEGFRFSWTAVKDVLDATCSDPGFFKCSHNNFCISKSLKCNNLPNCGYWDTSDEDRIVCEPEEQGFKMSTILTGIGVGCAMALAMILCCVLVRRRWKRKSKHRNNTEDIKLSGGVLRRPLNMSSIRTRQLASQSDFI